MNRKTIIQIVVITICFGGAGLVLYNGLFKKSRPNSVPNPVMNIPTSGGALSERAPSALVGNQGSEVVLPFGSLKKDSFDKVLKRQNFHFGRISYPKLDPDTDLGVQEGRLIPPIEKKQAEQP